MLRSLPSASLPVHCSLITLSFDAFCKNTHTACMYVCCVYVCRNVLYDCICIGPVQIVLSHVYYHKFKILAKCKPTGS